MIHIVKFGWHHLKMSDSLRHSFLHTSTVRKLQFLAFGCIHNVHDHKDTEQRIKVNASIWGNKYWFDTAHSLGCMVMRQQLLRCGTGPWWRDSSTYVHSCSVNQYETTALKMWHGALVKRQLAALWISMRQQLMGWARALDWKDSCKSVVFHEVHTSWAMLI